jgi:hypothetical protein
MNTLEINTKPEVQQIFNRYPANIRKKMENLRKMVFQAARETEGIVKLEETLKWGEPSYLTKHGSTIRMDWKPKSPDQYAMYFKCTSRLVETFRTVFGDTFTYEGNRAIVFSLDDKLPEAELKTCIKAALTYHKVKHLDTLGI